MYIKSIVIDYLMYLSLLIPPETNRMGSNTGRLVAIDPPPSLGLSYTARYVDVYGEQHSQSFGHEGPSLAGMYGQIIDRKVDRLLAERSTSRKQLQEVKEELIEVKQALQETRDQLQFLIGLMNVKQADQNREVYVENLKKQ